MYYGAIKNCDIADGPGIRISLFVSGCRNRCPGCFQPETWSFTYGSEYTAETEEYILKLLAPDYIDGITVLGGDPFEPENQQQVLELLEKVREKYPKKNVWAYTGYTLEKLMSGEGHPSTDITQKLLMNIDVLVDGPFVEEKKDISLQFRGSSNQRIIDMNGFRKEKRIVLIEDKKRGSFY